MKKFNIIKKSRKKSADIDEKIEYLNRECRKNGLLSEIMTTTNMYSTVNHEPNPLHVAFTNSFLNGEHLGFSGSEYQIYGNLINGVAYSPPHPSTGQRTMAQTYRGLSSGFGPLIPGYKKNSQAREHGSVLWYFDVDVWKYLEWSFQHNAYCSWATNFIGFPYHTPATGVNSPLSSDLKNALNNLNIQSFTPDEVGPPTNPVLVNNNLGDPSFLPINIDGISPQAFDYLKNQAGIDVASNVNYDVYEKLWKEHGIEAANWYENNPDLPGSSNPHVNPLIPLPLELVQNDSRYSDVVSDIDINTGLGAKPGDQLAFGGFGGGKPTPPTKKSDFKGLKRNAATTAATMSVNGMGMSPAAFEKKYGISPQDFLNLPENKTSDKKYLEEGVKLGHFEPEVLNVDINDIRKGIIPEFPKDPPPEMIGGYSAKSRLVRKEPEFPPFIKVTKKDLAKNHKLTDKEIKNFLDDVKSINEYIKKNPAELKYAMIR